MDVKVLAICDAEKQYALRLMEALCEKKNLDFQVRAFSDEIELEQFAADHPLEILLINGRLMSKELEQFHIGKIILLSDGDVYEEFLGFDSIYKYQSADRILKELLCYCAEYARPLTGMYYGKKEFEVHGVYSPIGRCGKSALAEALAEAFGKKKKTILLDLQSFSASLEQRSQEELWDLADMIYFLRQGKQTFLYKLGSIVQSKGSFDYILPMKAPADLRSVTLAEWTELLEKLSTDSEYQVVILDLGAEVSGIFQLLSQCTKVYMPVLTDADSKRKIGNFENILREENFEKILQSMYRINVPIGTPNVDVKAFMEEWTERFVML